MKRFIGLLVCTLILVTPVSASASHNYHSNMISKNFSSTNDGGYRANQKADKWVNHISDLSSYHVSNTQSTTGRNYCYSDIHYTNHVTLIRKHESSFQRRVTFLLRGMKHGLYKIDKDLPA